MVWVFFSTIFCPGPTLQVVNERILWGAARSCWSEFTSTDARSETSPRSTPGPYAPTPSSLCPCSCLAMVSSQAACSSRPHTFLSTLLPDVQFVSQNQSSITFQHLLPEAVY